LKLGSILTLLVILVALGVYFLFFRPEPPPEPLLAPRPPVWDVEMEELQHMVISLPQEDMSEAWVKHEDRYWYFDNPPGPKVDMDRWGGGIPLLLSGPKANRLIEEDATEERLAVYGFTQPRMEIVLTLENEDIIDIEVGDSTPDGIAYYVKLADSTDVYTVDYTWYDVLERLVLEPPYPWDFDMDELQHIVIRLPHEDKSEAFIKHEDRYWYFDYPEGPRVDMSRWRRGIPLLLSGPGAERHITDATEEKLAEFGFTEPLIQIVLTLENGEVRNIALGNSTPDGSACYVKFVNSNDVYTVDYTWYEVFEGLVLNPPYPPPEEE